jgi:peroxiredoxin
MARGDFGEGCRYNSKRNRPRENAMNPPPATPRWMTITLTLAAAYNVTWGSLTVLFPDLMFAISGFQQPGHAEIDPNLWRPLWQGLGLIIGLFGVGYWLSAGDPVRHWPFVFVGLLSKVLGPIGSLDAVLRGRVPAAVLYPAIPNDLIWWAPFGLILLYAYRQTLERGNAPVSESLESLLERVKSEKGHTLAELSSTAPTLVVFLRHLGCPWCREALADLSGLRVKINADGTQLAFIHMGDVEQGKKLFQRFGLDDAEQFGDPECVLYRAFGLQRVGASKFLTWRALTGGYRAFRSGHLIGQVIGDPQRMPGVFLLHHGRIVRAFRHESPEQVPNYAELACPLAPTT